jgi:regulator of sigma E protease
LKLLFTIVSFLVALGVLITFHELGHYLVARLAGVRVLRFSVGFGRAIWMRRFGRDPTEWVIAVVPLGGYVKMLDEREGEVPSGERHRAFNRQSVWRRFAIVIAGPLANFMLAIALYCGVFIYGVQELKPVVAEPSPQTAAARAGLSNGATILRINGEEVKTWQGVRWRLLQLALEKSDARLEVISQRREISLHQLDLSGLRPEELDGEIMATLGLRLYRPDVQPVIGSMVQGGIAERAGLQVGDRIRAIDRQAVELWDHVVRRIRHSPEVPLVLEVERNGRGIEIQLVPEAVNERDARIGRIGAAPLVDPAAMRYLVTEIRYGVLESVPKAIEKTWDTSVFSIRMLWKMLMGDISWRNISGPVTIADYAGQSAQLGFVPYLSFLALISISLGVLNLLPIPLLDGGNLMYYSFEIVRGRPVSERALEIGQQVGLFLLLTLMAFAFYNDINRLFPS